MSHSQHHSHSQQDALVLPAAIVARLNVYESILASCIDCAEGNGETISQCDDKLCALYEHRMNLLEPCRTLDND